MKKYIMGAQIVAVILIAVLTASGCAREQTKKQVKAEQVNLSATDDAGKNITLKKKAKRIVSMAPSNTEILFALDLGDNVVGVTDYCDFPAEAKKKTKIGGFSEPNIEKIISLDPDLVIAVAGVQDEFIKRLREADIKVFVSDPRKVKDIPDLIARIGRLGGAEDKADELADELDKRIDAVIEKVGAVEDDPLVFYEVYSEPLMTVGAASLIADVIKTAGGVNLGDKLEGEYPQISLEKLISEDPQVYVASTGSMAQPKDIAARSGWEALTAVKESRIYILDENKINRAGPRLIDALEELAGIIHPEQFE